MQTSLRRRHRDRVVRRGIGMTIEVTRAAQTSLPPPTLTFACCSQSDFYATEAGRQHFTDQLTSIRYVSGTTAAASIYAPQPRVRVPNALFARAQCVQETCNFVRRRYMQPPHAPCTHTHTRTPVSPRRREKMAEPLSPSLMFNLYVERWCWPDGVTEDMLPDIYPGWATPLRMEAA